MGGRGGQKSCVAGCCCKTLDSCEGLRRSKRSHSEEPRRVSLSHGLGRAPASVHARPHLVRHQQPQPVHIGVVALPARSLGLTQPPELRHRCADVSAAALDAVPLAARLEVSPQCQESSARQEALIQRSCQHEPRFILRTHRASCRSMFLEQGRFVGVIDSAKFVGCLPGG